MMSRCCRPIVAFVAGLMMFAGVAFAGAADDAPKAIRAVFDRQVADWNKGDLDAFLTGYWNSPQLVFLSGGDKLTGFDSLRERYRKRYQQDGKEMGKLDFSDLEIEPLAADAAFARGRWHLTLKCGAEPAGRFTVIMRLRSDGWKIVHDHTSNATP